VNTPNPFWLKFLENEIYFVRTVLALTHIAAMVLMALSAMGSNGDMLPLFWTAVKQHVTVHLVVQPFQWGTVTEKLIASRRFTPSEGGEETLSVESRAYQVSFTPPQNCAPKVEKAEAAEVNVLVVLRHLIFKSDEDVEFHVWAPQNESWNEKAHQEKHDLDKIAFKLSTYGDFLTKWQATLSVLDTVLPTSGVYRISNCYDQESNLRLFEDALGYKADMYLRVGTLSLMDTERDNKLYALSERLCPRKLHLGPTFVKDVRPKEWTLAGVIREPRDVFPAEVLPENVASFLDAEPTMVVTLSSMNFGSLFQRLLGDRRCLFISSTVDTPSPSHMHWPGQLNLDAVFEKASLIIHACGAGTAYQAVCASKPSICVTLTKEQANNARRLVYKGAAVHFALVDLKMEDQAVQDSFAEALDNPVPVFADGFQVFRAQAIEQGNGLYNCVKNLAERLQHVVEREFADDLKESRDSTAVADSTGCSSSTA
jgi:hypothetical protein